MGTSLKTYLGVVNTSLPKPSSFWNDSTQKVGIELEWEDQPIESGGTGNNVAGGHRIVTRKTHESVSHWGYKMDHSLRGEYPYEVFTTGPKGGSLLYKTIQSYEKWYNIDKLKPCLSDQTSTHVHLDVRLWDLDTLQRFIVLFALLEDELFSKFGKNRRYNVFCVPLSDMLSSKETYKRMIYLDSNDNVLQEHIRHISRNCNKYASLNLRPMVQFGSIEIRLAEGMADPSRIILYLQTLFKLTSFIKTFVDRNILLEEFFRIAAQKFKNQLESYFSTLDLLFREKLPHPRELKVNRAQKKINLNHPGKFEIDYFVLNNTTTYTGTTT